LLALALLAPSPALVLVEEDVDPKEEEFEVVVDPEEISEGW
jgi:hypothetical protein